MALHMRDQLIRALSAHATGEIEKHKANVEVYLEHPVGIDRAKMRLYDCEQNAQKDMVDNGSGEDYNDKEEKAKKSFEGFKF